MHGKPLGIEPQASDLSCRRSDQRATTTPQQPSTLLQYLSLKNKPMMKGKARVTKPPRHQTPNIGKHMIIFVTILINNNWW